ncbi:MAG: hypothetical protein ACE5NC_02140 [Anaerolineae bacterium]
MASEKRVQAVLDRHREALLDRAHVVGVGIGQKVTDGRATGPVCLVVMVTEKLPAEQLSSQDRVPAEIEGIPTDVVEVGVVRAQTS